MGSSPLASQLVRTLSNTQASIMLKFTVFLCLAALAKSESLAPIQYSTPAPSYHPTPTPYLPSPSPYHAPYAPYHHPSPVPHHAPHHKNGYCDPKLPPYCANATGLHYCLEDPHYPEYEIKNAISADYIFLKKYSDIADQSADDLVEAITAHQEATFDYNYYTGASKGPSPYDVSHWIGPEGYLCPSEVLYAMPKRARNVNGDWRVIVNNAHYYTQTTRLETCLTPDSACRLLAPCYQSKCTQKYVYERMLAFDPCDPYKGLFIDVFKFPSACSCHIPQPHN